MKRVFMIVLAALLLTTLVACGGDAASESVLPVSSSSPVSSVIASESEFYDSPTFLNDELFALFEKAQDTFPKLTLPDIEGGYAQGIDENTPTIETEDGVVYSKASGAYTKWDDFYNDMTQIYTEDYFNELIGMNAPFPYYINEDGDLYLVSGARGSNIEWVGPDLYKPGTASDDKVEFELIGQYEDFDTQEPYTESFPIEMVRTQDGWRISQFAITY